MADEMEIWEMQTGGKVWVEVVRDKVRGTTRMMSVGGKGSRLRISPDDRRMAQERVRDKNNDPFTNGLLLRVDADQQADEETRSPSALSDADLKKILSYKQMARFLAALEDLSEVSLRRLKTIVDEDQDVSVSQRDKVREVLEAKFGVNRGKEDLRDASDEKLLNSFKEMKLSG